MSVLLAKEFIEEKLLEVREWLQEHVRIGMDIHNCKISPGYHDANKLKWVVWVNKCLEGQEQFKDVIFTDECTMYSLNVTEESPSVLQMPQEDWNTAINIL